jgi:non-heme Fe2+,alpha-ketoglutarate-dependent halogenase
MVLTPEQISQYRTEGWVAPIDVFSTEQTAGLLEEFERAEASVPEYLHAENRNNAHLQFPFLCELALNEVIVDAARSLVGDNMVLWSTVLFVKEPDNVGFVSWHQDANYMGMDSDNFVTAWLGLTPSNADNGCVAVIPRTHLSGQADHEDHFEEDNILTRGQTVAGVDPAEAVNLVLEPGQMSLHHPWLVHGSRPNKSDARRIGLAMQSYMGPDVHATRGEHHVLHVAGAPVPPGFIESSQPVSATDAAAIATREAANKALADVLYYGAEKRRKL